MASATLGSANGYYFPPITIRNSPAFDSSLVIDATGEKIALIGRVVWQDRADASKDITKIGFRFGAVTKAGGSGLTVSLQDVSTTASPTQPDETQDQTVAIANGDAGFTSNVWYTTAALSANRTVNFGDEIAVVIEYDGSGRLGADSVVISAMTTSLTTVFGPTCALKTASWAIISTEPNIIFEFADGAFGTFDGALGVTTLGSVNINTGTTPDEVGMLFQFPFPVTVEGAWVQIEVANNSADFDLILYNSAGTALQTLSADATKARITGSGQVCYFVFATPQALTKNTDYRLVIKPTTANNVGFRQRTLNSATYRPVFGGGTAWAKTERTDAGAWTDTTTLALQMGLKISAGDDGAGGSGGGGVIY